MWVFDPMLRRTKAAWPAGRRLLVEGAAIIASILLALAIDAWWDNRSERIQERAALQALAVDFEAAAAGLAAQLVLRDSTVVAADWILGRTGPAADRQQADSLRLWLPQIMRLGGFDPPLGTLDALLGSGELRLVRNPALRAALAAFPSALNDVKETQSFAATVHFGLVLPYLNQYLPLQSFGLRGRGESSFEGDPLVVMRSLEFENLVQNRLMNTEFQIDGLSGLQRDIDAIRTMLDAELSR